MLEKPDKKPKKDKISDFTLLNKISMLQKLKENKWIVIAVVLVLIVGYYFYQKNYQE